MSEHRWTARREKRLVGTAAAGIAGSLVGTVWFGPIGIIGAGVCAVAFMIAAAHWMLQHRRHGRDSVHVTSEGLEIHQGDACEVIEWADITALVAVRAREHVGVGRMGFRGATSKEDRTPRWSFLVRRGSTTVLTVDERWDDFERLAKSIDRRVRSKLEPELRAAIVAGRAVPFGVITLSADGVTFGGRLLAWSDVKTVHIEQGQLVIVRKPEGRFAAADIRRVENASTLVALAGWAPTALASETYRDA
jgi:hypothetical protein